MHDTAVTSDPSGMDFSSFLENLRGRLRSVFGESSSGGDTLRQDRLAWFLRAEAGPSPLSVFIPSQYGGRGQLVHESLSMLETCSYESLPLSLVAGINGALFLQPLSKYATPQLQEQTFARFLHDGALGGLMITEPEFGSDALKMRSSFRPDGEGYHLRGVKHWGGLTGHADYWLITAREETSQGELERNINFFVWDQSLGGIEVEEYFASLGLEMIPYGRNRIDTHLPSDRRMTPLSSGVRMLLDVLHRSRLQFPGMALGFLRRILDEATSHVRHRVVGGKKLTEYDQVQGRLAEIQAAYTACSAMCVYTSEVAAVEADCSSLSLPANAIKTVVTDMMQAAAQSLLQLVGAAGYRRDHLAGSGIVDSRPFQIFEGSNDILYEQIAEAVLKAMRRLRESNLARFLSGFDATERAAPLFDSVIDFSIDEQLPQRKVVDLGRILARIISLQMVIDLRDRGYRRDLVDGVVSVFRRQVGALAGSFDQTAPADAAEDYRDGSSWLGFLPSASTM